MVIKLIQRQSTMELQLKYMAEGKNIMNLSRDPYFTPSMTERKKNSQYSIIESGKFESSKDVT